MWVLVSFPFISKRIIDKISIMQPSHFLPRYSTLKWALCIPHGCSNENALEILNEFLLPFNSSGVKIYADVDENSCYVKKSHTSWSNILNQNWQVTATVWVEIIWRSPNDEIIAKNCSGYFTFFIVVTVVASLNDYWKILKLDVLFAPDKKKDIPEEETNEPEEETNESEKNELADECPESSDQVENESESTPKGTKRNSILHSVWKKTFFKVLRNSWWHFLLNVLAEPCSISKKMIVHFVA